MRDIIVAILMRVRLHNFQATIKQFARSQSLGETKVKASNSMVESSMMSAYVLQHGATL